MTPSLSALLAQLDAWRQLPAYRMEPRVDAFAALFLHELLERKTSTQLFPEIIPELPVRRGTLLGETTPSSNKSKKVDFAMCARDRSVVHLIEFKTDQRSRNENQDGYLAECGKRQFSDVLDGIRRIREKSAREYAAKYDALQSLLRTWGFEITEEGSKQAKRTRICVWYLQPQPGEGNTIGFEELARSMEASDGEFAKAVAPYFRKWISGPSSELHPDLTDANREELLVEATALQPDVDDQDGLRILAAGEMIHTVDDWFKLAPPKGKGRHWKDGRSAKELARLWCASGQPCVPKSVVELLDSNPDLQGTAIHEVRPEYRVKFDDLPGEPRNTDLVAIGLRARQRVALSVEAKADEPFSDLVADVLERSARGIAIEEWSNVPQRVQQVSRALLPPHSGDSELPRLGELRYQLLTATAGALAFAREVNAGIAVLIVHEFVGDSTTPDRLDTNARDLDRFVRRLTDGAVEGSGVGRLLGPIRVPGNSHVPGDVALFIGKLRTRVDGA